MRAVTGVVYAIVAENRMVGKCHVDAVAHIGYAVADHLRAIAVEQLDTVAALCRGIVPLAGDEIVENPHVLNALDPDSEQAVGDIAAADAGAMRARLDVDRQSVV